MMGAEEQLTAGSKLIFDERLGTAAVAAVSHGQDWCFKSCVHRAIRAESALHGTLCGAGSLTA